MRLMRNGPAGAAQPSGPVGDTVPDRWQQRAGFSVFFDVQPGGPGEPRRRTRLYHEETADEATFRGWGPTDWVRWMLDRLGSAQPPSEPPSLVSMEIIDARLIEDPDPGEDTVAVELQLRVSGMADLNRTLAARVIGVLFGPDPR
jgi:hypothetical protein